MSFTDKWVECVNKILNIILNYHHITHISKVCSTNHLFNISNNYIIYSLIRKEFIMQYVHVVLYYCEIYVNIANKYFVESSLELLAM